MQYVALRTHARIANLLTKEKVKEIAEAPGVEGFLEKLTQTPYGKIEEIDERRPDISLERAFYKKFIERIESIVRITPEKTGDFLMSYYQMRFEVINLKRIIRGKFSKSSEEEILYSLIPISPYQAGDYEKLAKAENLEKVIAMLQETPYRSLKNRMDLYEQYDALWPLELELNYLNATNILRSLGHLPSKNRRIIRKLVELETDIENVLLAIKQRGSRQEQNNFHEMFPATYGINPEKLEEIITAQDLRPVIQSLGTPYAEILGPIYEGDVALIRTFLRLAKYEHVTKARSADEFGFNVVMAYLVYSEIEKDNLVGIAWGKVQGLSSQELLKYVVIPRSD